MRTTIAMILTAAAVLTPLSAEAQNERAWLQLVAGGGSYAMSDLNRDITNYNQANPGAANFGLIRNGKSLGGAMGFEMPSRWNFGIGLDRMYAETKASDATGATEYQFNANGWRAFAEYSLKPIGHSSLRVGTGIGIIQESGKMVVSSPGNNPQEYKISGTAPLYEGYAGGDVWLSEVLSVNAAAGYRLAKLNSIKIEGGTLINNNGEATSTDYSGPYFRVGFKVAAGER